MLCFLQNKKVMSFDVLTQPSNGHIHVCSLEKQTVARSGFSSFIAYRLSWKNQCTHGRMRANIVHTK